MIPIKPYSVSSLTNPLYVQRAIGGTMTALGLLSEIGALLGMGILFAESMGITGILSAPLAAFIATAATTLTPLFPVIVVVAAVAGVILISGAVWYGISNHKLNKICPAQYKQVIEFPFVRFGQALQAPGSKWLWLVSRSAAKAEYAGAAYWFALGVIFSVPMTLSWSAGKMIEAFRKSSLRHSHLHLAPEPHIVATIENQQMVINEFKKMMRDATGMDVSQKVDIRIEPLSHEAFAEFRLLLCHLTLYMEECSEDVKLEILEDFADKFRFCSPSWLQTAKNQYQKKVCPFNSAETLIMTLVQDYKQGRILEVGQVDFGLQWHALSVVQKNLQNDFGLEGTFDDYGDVSWNFLEKGIYKSIITKDFENIDRMINAIQSSINERFDADPTLINSFQSLYAEILAAFPKVESMEYILAYCIQEQEDGSYRITKQGVALILSHLKIISL